MSDPFAVLGLPRGVEVREDELEARYLRLSREWHPDYHSLGDRDDRLEALRRSAELNDAYRALRDPWDRARRLIELSAPGTMEQKKQLCPGFLVAAMELAEEVDAATSGQRQALAARMRRTLDDYLTAITELLREQCWGDAATKLHEARYYRRAVERLDEARD